MDGIGRDGGGHGVESRYGLERARGVLIHFSRLVGWQAAVVAGLSLVATYLCLEYGIVADLPTFLIGTAIVFPIAFSLNAAYRRREEALRYFAVLRAAAVALFYAHRDWTSGDDTSQAVEMRDLVVTLLTGLAGYFSPAGQQTWDTQRLYALFSQISRANENLRAAGVPSTEISRANQYLRIIITEFEQMRNIYLYRTPLSLRAYTQVFLYSFPILFAPYFAFLSIDNGQPLGGYFIALLYSVVLVTLQTVQTMLENPFDEIGMDDVDLDVADAYHMILAEERPPNP